MSARDDGHDSALGTKDCCQIGLGQAAELSTLGHGSGAGGWRSWLMHDLM